MMILWDNTGQRYELEKQLGQGGEGAVYTVRGLPSSVVKLYHAHNPRRAGLERKLSIMVGNPPDDPTQNLNHVSIAWPQRLLYAQQSNQPVFVGYLMARASGRKVLDWYNPALRRQFVPPTLQPSELRRYLFRIGRNLASVIAAVHAKGYVVGDLNESNIFVTDQALVTIIDTDSFQVVTTAADGTLVVFPCAVGKPEYTAPDLQGKLLAGQMRQERHDCFALAVLLFQLLVEGNHPYRGVWLRSGDPPEISEKIRRGLWPYNPRLAKQIVPPPGVGALGRWVPAEVEQLFRQCFEADSPPTAKEWRDALAKAEATKLGSPPPASTSYAVPSSPSRLTNPGSSTSSSTAASSATGAPPSPSRSVSPTYSASSSSYTGLPAPAATPSKPSGGSSCILSTGYVLLPAVCFALGVVGYFMLRSTAPAAPVPIPMAPIVMPVESSSTEPGIPSQAPQASSQDQAHAGQAQSSNRISQDTAALVSQRARFGKGWITDIAFDRSESLIAIASSLGVYLYYNGEEVRFTATSSVLRAVTFSPDGKMLAGALDEGIIQLWRVSDGMLLRTLQGHSGSVRGIAISPDGKVLASASEDNTVRLWRVSDGALLHTLEGHSAPVRSVAFSPDGQTVASGGLDSAVRLWRASDGGLRRVLEGHRGGVYEVVFAPGDLMLASGDGEGTVRVWRSSDGALLHTLKGHTGGVRSVVFSPDGRVLVSAALDNTMRLWLVSDGALLQTIEGQRYGAPALAFSSSGRLLALGARDGTVKLWRVSGESPSLTLEEDTDTLKIARAEHLPDVNSIAFSPDGQMLAAGLDDGTVRLWRRSDDTLQGILLQGHTSWVRSVAFSPDGQLLASGSNDATVRLWRVSDGALLRTFEGHTSVVLSVAFSPDGQMLASASEDDTIRLWQVDSGALVRVMEGHMSDVYSVAFSPMGQVLASASDDNTVRLWTLDNGTTLRTFGHPANARAVAFSPDGQVLASGAADGNIYLWQVNDGLQLRVLQGHTAEVKSLAFSPDGQVLASGSADRTIRLWRVSDGALIHTLTGHTYHVDSVVFSPDGQQLASASWDGTLRLWGLP